MHNVYNGRILSPQTEQTCFVLEPPAPDVLTCSPLRTDKATYNGLVLWYLWLAASDLHPGNWQLSITSRPPPRTRQHSQLRPPTVNYQCQPEWHYKEDVLQLHKGAALNNTLSDTEQPGYQGLVVEYKAFTYMHTYIILRIHRKLNIYAHVILK